MGKRHGYGMLRTEVVGGEFQNWTNLRLLLLADPLFY
jgi:hypothetical protein